MRVFVRAKEPDLFEEVDHFADHSNDHFVEIRVSEMKRKLYGWFAAGTILGSAGTFGLLLWIGTHYV